MVTPIQWTVFDISEIITASPMRRSSCCTTLLYRPTYSAFPPIKIKINLSVFCDVMPCSLRETNVSSGTDGLFLHPEDLQNSRLFKSFVAASPYLMNLVIQEENIGTD
jgi:hypothetical protein